jgi:hypothetical protein
VHKRLVHVRHCQPFHFTVHGLLTSSISECDGM